MPGALDLYSPEYFEKQLRILVPGLSVGKSQSKTPHAVLLGGQSGAGKTRLHDLLKAEFDQNAIVINGDEYRRSHPNFMPIQEKYGNDAPAHTAKWAGQMTEALIDAFSQQGYNLIIEGTLRTSEKLKTLRNQQ